MIYIFWSCATIEEAKKIIHILLNEKLIACASIIPNVCSIYVWENSVHESNEIKAILKTQKEHFEKIEKIILDLGSYEVPEINQINIEKAHIPYLIWLQNSTQNINT